MPLATNKWKALSLWLIHSCAYTNPTSALPLYYCLHPPHHKMFNGFSLDGFVVVSARHSIKLKNGALSVNWKMKWFRSAFCFVHVISNRLSNEPQMNFCLSHFSAKFLLHLQRRRAFPALCVYFLHSWQQFVRPLVVTTSPTTCFLTHPTFLYI